MKQTQLRLKQEVRRLGGYYAHVLDEHIDSRRVEANGQSWLHGSFNCVLYRRPGPLRKVLRPYGMNQRQRQASKPNVAIQAYSRKKSSLNTFSRAQSGQNDKGKSSGAVIEFFFIA
jgi:hypothetical protein